MSLRARTLSAVLLVPVFLGIIFLGPIPFALLLGLLILIGGRELASLVNGLGWQAPPILPFAALMVFAVALLGWIAEVELVLIVATGLILLIWLARPRVPESPVTGSRAWGAHLVGGVYIGLFASCLARIHRWPGSSEPDGPEWVLFAVFLVWICDTGAYAFGRLTGRHRLWPDVSPAKTWEGAVGGLLSAVIGAVLLAPMLVPGLSTFEAAAVGGLAGIAAQVGDLIESRIKRMAGVKDSAGVIPGHGGILDRFDSLFFAAPLFYYYLKAFGR